MRHTAIMLHFAAVAIIAMCVAACASQPRRAAASASDTMDSRASTHAGVWNPKLAAAYLDQREQWWMRWKGAARGRSTFCVSCHTTVPYILARPALDRTLGQHFPSPDEQKLIDDVKERVRNWDTEKPYYGDSIKYPHQSRNARGTESVLNAFILVSGESASGHLSNDAQLALDQMWDEQIQRGAEKGAWPWQQFGLEPWESGNSVYYGATLAAVAVGMTPEEYRNSPPVQQHIALLRRYLNTWKNNECMFTRIELLWAATRFPGLIDHAAQSAIIGQVLSRQHADGGWDFPSLVVVNGWNLARFFAMFGRRRDGSPEPETSDGLATGIIVSALVQSGIAPATLQVHRGIVWLRTHQNGSDGSWIAYSYNKQRDAQSYVGRFMSDAATGYAVLALSETSAHPGAQGGS